MHADSHFVGKIRTIHSGQARGNTSLVLICRTAHSSNASLKAKQDIGQLTDIEPQRGRQPANLPSL
jgi:hypothetical protein